MHMTRASSTARPYLRVLTGSSPPPRRDDEPSDEALLQGIVGGDDRVAVHLHARLTQVIHWALRRVLGPRHPDHDDLVQATFEQVVTSIQRGSYHRECALNTWATAIASRLALNALRSRRRERLALDVAACHAVLSKDNPEGELDARAEIRRLRGVLSEIRPSYAEAVLQHDILGHSLSDVAQSSGVSLAAAQSRLVRGRREVFQRMGWGDQGGVP
jgi:RNA polymerase sigma-70 factor, ECF subfamily